MNIKSIILYSILITLIVSCAKKIPSIKPELKSITESVYASGYIKSMMQYEISGKTNGIIEKIYVTEGMHVKKDDPIFKLDNKNSRITTENARLASTANDYKVNAAKLRDAKKEIDLADKKLQNASLLFQRQKNLWNQNIGSKVELEQKELNYENSKVALANAKLNYNDLSRQLKLASDQSKNNLKIAKIMEDDFIIRSEVDGVIYKINKEIGELINGGEPAAIIGTDEFVIELNIDEFDIVKIKKGQQVFIRMDSYKSEVFEAEIISIDPMMNLRTRSFQAKASFTKKPAELYPNLTVEANIVISTKQNVLTIPRNYLINYTSVLLEGGKVQTVKTGLMDYDLVEIKSGLDINSMLQLPKE
ncbi:MAG: efflux RND transporter periplasmic adaptor subunit [Saprospiraceae bacterium]|nr:efflux RND transporter periplasmic adaptor subunit [Candidatus Brachybacter algidus]